MRRFPRLLAPLLLAAALAVGGCGSDDDDSGSGGSSGNGGSSSGSADVVAKDLSFSTKKIDAKPGKLTVTLKNEGQAPHEFVVLKTDTPPGDLKTAGDKAETPGEVGEIEEIEGGASASKEFDLEAGNYVFLCNVPGHYAAGMNGEIVVGDGSGGSGGGDDTGGGGGGYGY